MSISNRIEALRQVLQQEELGAMLVSSDENRRYMSGFTGSAGYLLVSQSDAVLATDFRYVEQAEGQAPEFRIEQITGGGWLPGLAKEVGAGRIGFESEDVTVARHVAMEKSISESDVVGEISLVETTDLLERMRGTKDQGEIELLTRAIKITDEALDEVEPSVKPGVTEGEIAWELEKAMRERGAEAMAFDIIVGAGPNGALPHHRADSTVIREGDAVVIDMGAQYEGYCADLTRTVLVGEPDETFWKVYNTVLEAQLAAEEQITAGMTGTEADAIARDLIAEAGYEENFGHSLGHGVGLAVHEYPVLGTKSEDVLEDGMVFTVEPGIYLSGWGGVRIEDVVVLENGRPRVVSKARKLTALG
jgi:Xaa-Pro aminopeptidase